MSCEILEPTSEAVARAADAIRAGQVVGMPTETVYGLAGDVFNAESLATIFSVKERPTFDPLICHVYWPDQRETMSFLEKSGLVDLSTFSETARNRVTALIQRFWPGPLTLVLPKTKKVPDLATSGLPTVAVRMPAHPIAQALIEAVGSPLAAPSANRFGRISPTEAEHVAEELGDQVPIVLDGGPCVIGIESTVIAVSPEGELTLLRPGGTPGAMIEEVAGVKLGTSGASVSTAQASPGMLASHYAPRTPLSILPMEVSSLLHGWKPEKPITRAGLLAVSGDTRTSAAHLSRVMGIPVVAAETLSYGKNWSEAARTFFSKLRRLDHAGVDLILAEPIRIEGGLSHALADRLTRAASARDRAKPE